MSDSAKDLTKEKKMTGVHVRVGDKIRWEPGYGNYTGEAENQTVTEVVGDRFWTDHPDNREFSVSGGGFRIVPPTTQGIIGGPARPSMDPVQTFETGARRDVTTGKSRPDLIPGGAMLRVGHHFGMGAAKYGERNFEKGIPSSRTLASLCRHVEQFKAGDKSEDHLAAIVANAIFLMFNEEKFEGDDKILDLERYGV